MMRRGLVWFGSVGLLVQFEVDLLIGEWNGLGDWEGERDTKLQNQV